MNEHKSKAVPVALVVGGLALLALIAIHFMWAANFWTGVYNVARSGGPVLALLGVLALFVGAFALANSRVTQKEAQKRLKAAIAKHEDGESRTGRNYYGMPRLRDFEDARAFPRWMGTVIATVGALVFVGMIGGLFFIGYSTDVSNRVAQVEFVSSEAPDFEARFPYGPAQALLTRNPGDFSNVEVADAGYTSAEGQWGAVVNGVGTFQPARGVVIKTGDTAKPFDHCEFDGDVKAIGGMFNNRLERDLRKVQRYTTLETDSISVWCTDEGAHVLIPAEAYHGFLLVHRRPAGVFVIDPSGEITFNDQVEAGEYPVPVLSTRVARDMVDANARLTRSGEVVGAKSVFFKSTLDSYERPEGRTSSSDNPDAGNPGEIMIRDHEGRPFYVTALTPLGADENVSALAVVSADALVAGELPTVTIYRLPAEQHRISNLEITSRLRVDFDAVIQWEAGYQIFELAPLSDGTWSATIGQQLEVKYRAVIDPDGTSCLYLIDSDRLVGCTGDSRDTRPRLDRIDGEGSQLPVGELTELTDPELLELMDGLLSELKARQDQ